MTNIYTYIFQFFYGSHPNSRNVALLSLHQYSSPVLYMLSCPTSELAEPNKMYQEYYQDYEEEVQKYHLVVNDDEFIRELFIFDIAFLRALLLFIDPAALEANKENIREEIFSLCLHFIENRRSFINVNRLPTLSRLFLEDDKQEKCSKRKLDTDNVEITQISNNNKKQRLLF